MSKRILVIGCLFCLCGFMAIWDVISGLINAHINLNFSVLQLPVGIGLLRGKSRSRWWARFWIVLGYIFCIFLVALAMVAPENVKANWFEQSIQGAAAVPYIYVIAGLLACLLVFVHKLLYSVKASEHFDN